MNTTMIRTATVTVAGAVLLAGCSSSSPGTPAAAPSTSPRTHTATSAPPVKAKVAVNPNVKACDQTHTLIVDRIGPTINRWVRNQLDRRVAPALRADGTDLFGLEAAASGATGRAIHAEASSLIDLSLAVDSQDYLAVSKSADRANNALAQIRGVCNF